MAEPPTKRPRRIDSSAMWDMEDRGARSPGVDSDFDRNSRRDPPSDDGRRGGPREDKRYRSRSRDRRDKRRERSRSWDRRDRDRDRRDRASDGREPRVRDRSVSRDRYTDRRGYPSKGDRYRDRSRSPIRNGTRDRTPIGRGSRGDRRNERRDYRDRANGTSDGKPRTDRGKEDVNMDLDDGEDDIEELIRRSMGFSKFRSTKNTKVPGNNAYGVRKEKKTEYRQYMNRQGGFNRPLSPSR
ncbi:hypothetical protein ASPVEDRAFT_86107 [Aspergillus versicolor CBS 583.65]|uniref:U4/U6.U5 small nuclear ribonucleoprotein 27kDa protein domain-containing protein n=1 Tax=Aspergillus versicolor CBS 583.65 TaxID=1036611 RepID=A0A1L9PT74_ASPVE|nr:uncharacterized protein ASPVEDRAFT_86107 [Aspergillus versicolor CBS 583.65]OJJ04724.1 hypothetical protein ASPVEDRAFT_86107 [Aspergillus versicolor CBS 583.65]